MQSILDTIVVLLKLQRFNDIPLFKKYCALIPQAKPAYFAFGVLVISFIFCLMDIAPDFFINFVGLVVPGYMALIGIKEGNADIHFLLPYFLIFSFLVVFHGVFHYLFSFIPAFHALLFIFVIALFHPDIKLAVTVWELLESIYPPLKGEKIE